MYAWGVHNVDSALAALECVPAVSRQMCDAVGEQFQGRGVGALFWGPITGTPYKIYAVQAGTGKPTSPCSCWSAYPPG